MDISDQYDCACVLHEAKDLIAAAHAQQLGVGFSSSDTAARIRGLQRLGLILDDTFGLQCQFRRVFDEVLAKRQFEAATIDDFVKIAARHSEWFDQKHLSALNEEAYSQRIRHFRGLRDL